MVCLLSILSIIFVTYFNSFPKIRQKYFLIDSEKYLPSQFGWNGAENAILVLGSGGLVGKALTTKLKEYGYSVVEVRNRHHLDLRKKGSLSKAFKSISIKFCFFLAFEVGGSKFIEAAEYQQVMKDSNELIYDEVFSYLKENQIPFMFASTQLVTSNSTYGKINLKGEIITTELGFGRSIRLHNAYGFEYSGLRSKVIPDIIESCITRNQITLNTNGKETRQFIHVDDLSLALVLMIDHLEDLDSVTSFTNGRWDSIIDVSKAVNSVLPDCKIIFSNKESVHKATLNFTLSQSSTRFFKKWWNPFTMNRPLLTGVTDVSNLYKEHLQCLHNTIEYSLILFSWDDEVDCLEWVKDLFQLLKKLPLLRIQLMVSCILDSEQYNLQSYNAHVTIFQFNSSVNFNQKLNVMAFKAKGNFILFVEMSVKLNTEFLYFLLKDASRMNAIFLASVNRVEIYSKIFQSQRETDVTNLLHHLLPQSCSLNLLMVPKSAFVAVGGFPNIDFANYQSNYLLMTLALKILITVQNGVIFDRVMIESPIIDSSYKIVNSHFERLFQIRGEILKSSFAKIKLNEINFIQNDIPLTPFVLPNLPQVIFNQSQVASNKLQVVSDQLRVTDQQIGPSMKKKYFK